MSIHIGTLGEFSVYMPTSGGKAGTGHNRTSTIQVRRDNMVVKQIRFNMADGALEAVRKAKAWILEQQQAKV